jgi:hypothetical protein
MASRRSILLQPLAARLAALGTRLGDEALEDVLADLSALPAKLIVRASQEIATAAKLGWWQQPSRFSFQNFFGESSTKKDLLRKNPDYAWLFLFHPSGYIREAALDAINSAPASPFLLSALAWRLNDWVQPVRQAAKRCAERVLRRADADVAANAGLYLLDRRLVWSRWSDELKILDSIFGRKDVIAALTLLLQEHSTGRLAACLRNALRYPNVDEHLPRLAAASVQPSVRAPSPTSASSPVRQFGPWGLNGPGSTRFMACAGVFQCWKREIFRELVPPPISLEKRLMINPRS